MKNIRLLLITLFVLGSWHPGFGWNRECHRYTAIIAYQMLSPNMRSVILKELKNHPMYREHFLDLMPKTVSQGNETLREVWLFSQMAFWPDLIKYRDDYEDENRSWHYINYPVFLTKKDSLEMQGQVPVNLTAFYDLGNPEDWNASQAFYYNRDILRGKVKGNKAIALCWLFHIIGDIHQPMHTSSLFGVDKFKDGDKGGNLVRIYGVGKIHWFWDKAPEPHRAFDRSFQEHMQFSAQLMRNYKILLTDSLDFYSDTLFYRLLDEGQTLARQEIYTREIRKLIYTAPNKNYGWRDPLLIRPEGSYRDLKWHYVALARERLVLAGVRLAGFLNGLY